MKVQKPKRAITHPTHLPQIKDEAAQKPTRTIFLSLILFSPRYSIGNSGRRMDFTLHGGVVFSLWLNQVKGF